MTKWSKLILPLLALLPALLGAQEVTEERDGMFSTREIKLKTALQPGSAVVVRAAASLQGKILIATGEDNEARAVFRKQAKTDRKRIAEDYVDAIGVGFVAIPEGIRLELRAPNPPAWSDEEYGAVDLNLVLPPDCEVTVDAVYFDMTAEGPFSGLVNTSSLGRLKASLVKGVLDLSTANQRIELDSIIGSVSAVTSNESITCRALVGNEDEVYLRNDNGAIRVNGLTGSVRARSSFARIDIARFIDTGQKSYVRCQSGPIRVEVAEMTVGDLVLVNEYEDIEVTLPDSADAVLVLAVDEDSRIEVVGLPTTPELVQGNRLNLVAGKGNALVSANIKGEGNIYIRGGRD